VAQGDCGLISSVRVWCVAQQGRRSATTESGRHLQNWSSAFKGTSFISNRTILRCMCCTCGSPLGQRRMRPCNMIRCTASTPRLRTQRCVASSGQAAGQ
jgi:hypothetical protein